MKETPQTKVPRKLYHGTAKRNLPTILKHGLDPKNARRKGAGVYLAGDVFTSENYANMYPDEDWVVLEVNGSMLDPAKLDIDDYELPDAWENDQIPASVMNRYGEWKYLPWELSLKYTGQITYNGKIPPKMIKVRE